MIQAVLDELSSCLVTVYSRVKDFERDPTVAISDEDKRQVLLDLAR